MTDKPDPKPIPADAKRKATMQLRFKGGRLQQRFLIEEKKATYYRWLDVPAVAPDAED
jgi:hypothetical protein